jgi:hypothetical protein
MPTAVDVLTLSPQIEEAYNNNFTDLLIYDRLPVIRTLTYIAVILTV